MGQGVEGVNQKGKRTRDMDNRVVIAGGEGGLRGLNDNGTKYKDYILKKIMFIKG